VPGGSVDADSWQRYDPGWTAADPSARRSARTAKGDAVSYPLIPSPNFTAASSRPIDVVVIHTMESPERAGAAEACARWFARPEAEVSAHYCVDADSVVQCVREEDVAWHARGGNANSVGIELTGYAGQGAEGWGDAYSRAVLRRAARLTAEICGRYAVPVHRLRAADLAAGRRGITGHADVSAAFRKSDHWDPGPDFPWTLFLRLTGARHVVQRAGKA
jgi:N-acetyl-anhydromuramyl-L-alanine amidase AmpD